MPFPQSRTFVLTYPDRISVSENTVGSGRTYTYSLNNLYDPNVSGIGSQPVGFDQISAIYSRFRVLKVDVVVEFMSIVQTSATLITQVVGLTTAATDALPAAVQAWPGLPCTVSRQINNLGGSNKAIFTRKIQPWNVIGVPKRQYMTSLDYTCSPSGPPNFNVYLILWTSGLGSAVSAITFDIRLVYTIECMQPVMNTLS